MNQLIILLIVGIVILFIMNDEKNVAKILSKSKSLMKGNTRILLIIIVIYKSVAILKIASKKY